MKQLFSLTICILLSYYSVAQDGVGVGISEPHPSAVLHVQPDGDNKGMLIPRLSTSDRINIAPPSDANGLIVYDIDQRSLYHFDGNTWHQVGSPSGTIVMWSGTAIPQGWALCDGNWYNPNDNTDNGATQTAMHSVLTPNLIGRFIVGYNTAIADYDNPGDISSGGSNSGKTGGEDEVQLEVGELPTHSHSMNNGGSHTHTATASGGAHSHTVSWSRGSPQEDTGSNEPDRNNNGSAAEDGLPTELTINVSGSHSHTVSVTPTNSNHTHTINTTGNNESHENRPAYYVLAYIMKL
ncbi:tail fiber protein [Ekhidna sp.]